MGNIKNWKLCIVILVSLMMVLVGCNGEEGNANSGSNDEIIKIGATLPLTGPYAATGKYIRDGYEYWVKEVNESGGLLGKEVELTVVDDQSDESKAVSLLQDVISQDNVDLLLGGYPGSSAAAQMKIAEQHKMVYASMGGHMKSFKQGYSYSFGAPPLMGEWWYTGFFDFLETLPKSERPSTAAMISVNNPVGQSVRSNVLSGLERLDIELVEDELYQLPLDSAEPLVNKAKQADAELFFANGFFADGVQTVRAIRSLDYQPDAILQGIGTLTPEWEEELGTEGNYIFSGTAMHPDLPFEGVKKLNKQSQEKYGSSAPPYFMFGYAWAQVLGQGVEGAGSLKQEAIREWLKSNSVDTVGGTYEFDEKGLPSEISYLIQVIDGKPILVGPEEVAAEEPVYPDPHE